MTRIVFSVCLLLCLHACREAVAPKAAFYHWQTRFEPGQLAWKKMDSLGVERVYTKFFDVDWQTGVGSVPLAEVIWGEALKEGLEIVPTVFITNRVFLQLDEDKALDRLSERLWKKVKELAKGQSITELQIDCDWTTNSRDTYFGFLALLKKRLPDSVSLSATIRLHQLRYPERTGVPPVDRGMLMFYNMGNLRSWGEVNSILNLAIAEDYLAAAAYPILLDLALPIFRWGVLYRDGQMIRLLNGLTAADLRDSSKYDQLAKNRYELRQSGYIGGYYAYRGDQIRLESIEVEVLLAAAKLLHDKRPERWPYVSFYHLDSTLVDDFSVHSLQSVLECL